MPLSTPFRFRVEARYLAHKSKNFSWTDGAMTDRESTLLAGRVKWMEQVLGHPLTPPIEAPLPILQEEDRNHLLETAEDLYWNDLEWEKLTGEERLDEEFLTEMAFPGFLAFVRGLLLSVTMPDSLAPPVPLQRSFRIFFPSFQLGLSTWKNRRPHPMGKTGSIRKRS